MCCKDACRDHKQVVGHKARHNMPSAHACASCEAGPLKAESNKHLYFCASSSRYTCAAGDLFVTSQVDHVKP